MKFFLIFVVFSLSNPQQPALLGHRSHSSLIECQQSGTRIIEETQRIAPDMRVTAFCVSAEDFEAS